MSWWNSNNNNSTANSGWGSNTWGGNTNTPITTNTNASNSWGSGNTGSVWGSTSGTTTNNNNTSTWGTQTNTNVMNPNNDTMVDNPPDDAITALKFNPSYDFFAVSSWNNTISCYQYQFGNNNQINTRPLSQQKADRGVLCCCWDQTGQTVFAGGCDSSIRMWNVNKSSFVTLGNHNAGIKCIEYASDINTLITGSWDRTLVYWDIKSGQKVSTVNLPAKVFCSAQKGNVLVIGLSNKYVQVYDLRNPQKYLSMEKTVLKHQLRCMDIFPDQKGYACASIEGRTAIRHFDKFNTKNDFSFKCHRHQRGSDKHSQDVFAVNCVRFNQQFGTFASGGDDGQINIWDKENRSRLKHFEQIKMPNSNSNNNSNDLWGNSSKVNNSFMPITAIDFNKTGRILGYTTSYNWNKGFSYFDKANQTPQIYLHLVKQNEVDANYKNNS